MATKAKIVKRLIVNERTGKAFTFHVVSDANLDIAKGEIKGRINSYSGPEMEDNINDAGRVVVGLSTEFTISDLDTTKSINSVEVVSNFINENIDELVEKR